MPEINLFIHSSNYELALKQQYGIEADVFLWRYGYMVQYQDRIYEFECAVSGHIDQTLLKCMVSDLLEDRE